MLIILSSFMQGSKAISSADLFGHDVGDSGLDLTAADLINRISFQVPFVGLLLTQVPTLTLYISTKSRNALIFWVSVWCQILLQELFCLFRKLVFTKSATLHFQASQDMPSLKDIAGETGKKLTTLASSLINDLQDRILQWCCIEFICMHHQRPATQIMKIQYEHVNKL